ncbi:MAG: 16S rRNA (cytosine(1402)-N(4))-methyltransferase RsmH [Bryobacterales bacterium]|nr:16S rRNA (cytosine(1402)-N(4))-methyltransferase RsmH [Bryobacteraceae bacterium]MDW8130983.1 16S rRNA (cytosine(1402)-N(4))-methyltransferase RsmH [Bryobacterales bacterium]
MSFESPVHVPVLLEEVLRWLAVRPDGVYVDATAGLGGHTAAIARRLTTGVVIANDCDAESLELARRNTQPWAERIRFRQGWFSTLPEACRTMGFPQVDGLLADLGPSFAQLTSGRRGFSFAADGPLDMRFDPSTGLTASQWLDRLSYGELVGLLVEAGEERRLAERIVRAILRARPLRSTRELARVVEEAVPRRGRLHPATRTFMALRRLVNREQQELAALLEAAPALVRPGGRVVIIAFMSTEDRQVKRSFQEWIRQGRAVRLHKHVVRPAPEEVRANPAARSARLRAVEIR